MNLICGGQRLAGAVDASDMVKSFAGAYATRTAMKSRMAELLFNTSTYVTRCTGFNSVILGFPAFRLGGPVRLFEGNGNDESQSAQHRRVEILLSVGSQNCQTLEFSKLLQEPGVFELCIPVVTVLHLGAFAKKSICFVKEQDRTTSFGGSEQPAKILFGLADVFAHDRGKINAIKIE